jgi:predicted tellurium resistance membrane protein TerC
MEIAIALLALTAMEIVLGIDNIVFITIVTNKLPAAQQPLARKLGLGFALVMRLALLATIGYVVRNLTQPLFDLTSLGVPRELIARFGVPEVKGVHGPHVEEFFKAANGVSWKDIILFVGGGFLIAKSVFEIHEQMNEQVDVDEHPASGRFWGAIIQIGILDIIFSLDSVITAVGMVKRIWVMMTAVIISMLVMLIFAEPISRFIGKNPTLKMLALSFMILIGVVLVAESIGSHMDKGYIYFAMCFALIVEMLNMRLRKKQNRHRSAI